jgi:hypothetical protein
VTNVYNRTVDVNNRTVNNVSYNGGSGGVVARPTAQEETAAREQHVAPLAAQTQHANLASQNRQNFAAENHGRPAIAATAKPGDFSNRSAVSARAAGGEYHAPAMSPKEARVAPNSAGNKSPANRPSSSEGFRPFTPPNSSHSPSNNSSSNNNNSQNNNRGSSSAYQQRGNSEYDRPASHPPQSNAPKPSTSRPPLPHQSAPPQHSGPPKEEHHKGR